MKRTGKCVRREAQMSVRGKVQGERGGGGEGGARAERNSK